MKTFNQVLLALFFTAFSYAGFAQTSTTPSKTTQKEIVRIHSTIMELENAEEEDEAERQHQDNALIKIPCKYCFVDEDDSSDSSIKSATDKNSQK
jgi:hypothetical protein